MKKQTSLNNLQVSEEMSFIENQKNAIINLGAEFCNMVCEEFKEVDKQRLLEMWAQLLDCPIEVPKKSSRVLKLGKVYCTATTKAGTPCQSAPQAGSAVCKRHNGEVKAKSPSKLPQCAGVTKSGSRCRKSALKDTKFCQMHAQLIAVEVKPVIEEVKIVEEEMKVYDFVESELDDETIYRHIEEDENEMEYWIHIQSNICIHLDDGEYMIIGCNENGNIIDYDRENHPMMTNIKVI